MATNESEREESPGFERAKQAIRRAEESLTRVLLLDKLALTKLPDSLFRRTQLRELYLDGNQLITLPEAIGQLTGLEVLSLDGNQLVILPEAIGQCTKLRRLSLNNNQLTTLPEAIGKLTGRELSVAMRAKRLCLCVQYFQANLYLGDTDETHEQSPRRRAVGPSGGPV
jgi:Leucine-rich repeat (LRR) protein